MPTARDSARHSTPAARWCLLLVATLIGAAQTPLASAQSATPSAAPSAQSPTPSIAPSYAPVPEPQELIDLVKATISAVDAGMKADSYTALHAMGSPAFKSAYSATSLAPAFAQLKSSGLDLAAVSGKVPQTSRPPSLDRAGRLRILGYYELPSKQVVYDVLYEYDAPAKRWLVDAISVKDRTLPPQPQLMQPQ